MGSVAYVEDSKKKLVQEVHQIAKLGVRLVDPAEVEKGEPRSIEILGEIYARGDGAQRNFTKALEWLILASRVMYLKGIRVNWDVKIPFKIFINAFDAGQPKAFYQLEEMSHTGVSLKKNVPLDYDVFVDAYTEILSEGLPVQSYGFDVESQCSCYASLLCHYGVTMANQAYTSDNDDPPNQRNSFLLSNHESVIVTLE
ncbi:hypothetical protein CQW23_23508 [Capsicum baccatum]|uniref:Uncharacterized protein n=1 Tax=Capsicum baccatum TaxID=33114 RepID=A0A2G2VS63_CAPBA|nr:hypothetical protein CQW23_23508 [Capsicum baccatum]